MFLSILIILKTILYMNITRVEYNKLIILLFTSLLSIIILSGVEFSRMKSRGKKTIQIIFYLLFSTIAFVDIMYYSYFQSLPSVALLGQAGQLGAVKDIILIILSMKNLLMIIDLPFVIYYIIKKQGERDLTPLVKTRFLFGLVSLFALVNIVAISEEKIPALKSQELFSYHTGDIINYYFKEGVSAREELERLISFKERKDEEFQLENKKYEGIGHGKNLILIQVESLQNFVIDLEYNGQEITPHINKLIKEKGSLYFDEYFQITGVGNTSDAEFITHNSLHPSMEEYTYSQYSANRFYGLPWLLRDQGYNAWAFHGFEKEFWNREEAYGNQGFQRFLSEEDYEFSEEDIIGFGINDEEFFKQSLEYIKELDSIDDNPFYGFLITLSCHTPYTMDEKYQVLDIKEEHRDNIVGDYLQAAHYADREIGRFIDNLKEEVTNSYYKSIKM